MNTMTLKEQKRLFADLALISRSKMMLPILSSIMLDAHDIHATNLDIGVTFSVKTGLTRQWAVDTANLMSILKTTKNRFEFFEDDYDNCLYAISDNQKIRLQTSDPADFPIQNEFTDCKVLEMTNMGIAIKAIQHAISKDTSRFNLDTVCMYDGPFKGYVATDGHKLALCGDRLDVTTSELYRKEIQTYMLPSQSIPFLSKQKTINLNDVTMDVSANKKFMRVYRQGSMIVIRLVEGQYPEWPKVVPGYSNNKHQVYRSELLDILEKALPLTDKANNTISVTLNGSMQVDVMNGPDKVSTFTGQCFTDDTLHGLLVESRFLINCKYVLDTVKALNGSTFLKIGYSSPGKPIEFVPVDNWDQYSIVMPLRK